MIHLGMIYLGMIHLGMIRLDEGCREGMMRLDVLR